MNDYPRAAIGFGQPISDGETDLGRVHGPGNVEPIPDACLACGASRENRYYRIEG